MTKPTQKPDPTGYNPIIRTLPPRKLPTKRALVTGSHGFIGRHFVQYLKAEGYAVTSIDTAATTWPERQDCRDFFRADMSESTHPVPRFDLVIHAAARIGGRQNIDYAPLFVAENLAIDSDMFRWAAKAKPRRVVYFSSCAVYPTYLQTAHNPITLAENHTIPTYTQTRIGMPDQMYGWAKLTGELLAEHARAAGVPVTVVRPFSGYGEDQDLDYPFPSLIKRMTDGDNQIDVWGDGTQVRHWIHVDDIVQAVMTLVHEGVAGPVNLAEGQPISFNDLIALMAAEDHSNVTIKPHPDKPTGPNHRAAGTYKLSCYYTPTITLQEGIRRSLAKIGATLNAKM